MANVIANTYLVSLLNANSGARIERRDKDNFTPLLIAASNGHSATISVLLKYGANIRAVDKHEKSSIYWAAQENEVQALKARTAKDTVTAFTAVKNDQWATALLMLYCSKN